MDELSAGQKWLTFALMLLVTAGTVYGTRICAPELQHLALAYGPAGYRPQMYAWGATVAVCLAVWAATYVLCMAIQRRATVWHGFNFLPVLLLAVIGLNFGPQIWPRLQPYIEGTHASSSTDQQALQALWEHNVAEIITNHDTYDRELGKAGFPAYLDPAKLGTPHGVERAQATLKKARALFADYRARDDARVARIRSKIEHLDISDELKKQALAGFSGGANSMEAARVRLWDLQDSILAEAEAMLADLARCRDYWDVEAGRFVFQRKRDLDKFEMHRQALLKMSDEGKALERKLKSEDPALYAMIGSHPAGRH